MKTWALIDKSLVVEVIQLADDVTPGIDMFTPEVAANMVDATTVTGIELDWTYTGNQFVAPPTIVAPPLTVPDLLAYASLKQNTILAQVWTVDVGTSSAPLKLTSKLDQGGQNAMLKLALWGMLNASTSGATEPYSNVDYSTATLTPAQATNMAVQAGAIVSSTYGVLNTLADQIQATPPTITTKAQVDAASWPSPT